MGAAIVSKAHLLECQIASAKLEEDIQESSTNEQFSHMVSVVEDYNPKYEPIDHFMESILHSNQNNPTDEIQELVDDCFSYCEVIYLYEQ